MIVVVIVTGIAAVALWVWALRAVARNRSEPLLRKDGSLFPVSIRARE